MEKNQRSIFMYISRHKQSHQVMTTLWKPILLPPFTLLKLEMTSKNLSVFTGQWNGSLVCDRNSFTFISYKQSRC